MNDFIYLRGLRKVDHTVFCVEDGQKYYWDQQFGVRCAYSSGQQVKRSIIDSILNDLREDPSPIYFNYEKSGNKINPKEAWSECDPSYTDQLLGGWMKAKARKKGKKKKDGEEDNSEKKEETHVIKRRSPFSISAMRPLHPLVGGLESNFENMTFDRSNRPERHQVLVRENDSPLSEEDVIKFLSENNLTLPKRIWVPGESQKNPGHGPGLRATGLFIYDIAIDLRTLFCIQTDQHEPELSIESIKQLKDKGWVERKNIFGKCLVCPQEKRIKIIDAIAYGLINWRITSNQSRTFSLMETLAIAISNNANKLAYSIRAELSEKDERKAFPVIDFNSGTKLFVTPSASAHIAGIEYKHDALEKAEEEIKQTLLTFDYENQLAKV